MLKKTTKKKRNPSSKSKQKTQKPRRLKTFHESNCSLLEDPPNPASISDLFKNEALKKKHQPLTNASQINFSSTINNYTSVYTVISSVHQPKPQKTKSSKNIGKTQSQGQKKKQPQKAKSKSKLTSQVSKQGKKRKQPTRPSNHLQQYQLIPPSKNSLNSQIVFSIQQTKRQSQWQQKRKQQSSRIYDSLVRVSQQNLINNNRLLRSTIKQEFKKKNEAATKIQKVFRGYLTRRILQKYIREEQEKLYGLLENYRESTHGKPLKLSQSKHSQHNDMEFFSNRTHQFSPKTYKDSPKTFKDEESINLSKVNPSHYRLDQSKVSSDRAHSNRFFHQRQGGDIVNCEDEVMSSSDGIGASGEEDAVDESDNENRQEEGERNQEDSEGDVDEQSSSSEQIIAYRHQQVIYNGAQIQQYLQSSSEQQQGQSDEKIPKIISQDQIIFQTNEEYIQSRKNSLLNKQSQHAHQHNKSNKIYDTNHYPINKSPSIPFNGPQQTHHQFIYLNEKEEFVDQDLIKTSKVNSIHSHSQKESIKSSETVSPKTKKEILEAENYLGEQPSQRTSKKQCKKVISHQKHPIANQCPNTSSFSASNTKNTLTLEHPTEHLNTIKLPTTEKYSPPNIPSKQAFMDTISYNTQFKAKHQINTNEQLAKRKQSMKKKIYYFSDEEQQEKQRKDTPRSGKSSRQIQPNQLERLKNLQMERWDQVIRLMNCQLKDMTHTPAKSKQFQSFIKQVMDLSLKNKEILKEMMSHDSSFNKSQATFKNSRIDQILQEKDTEDNEEKLKKWKDFKQTLSSGRRKSITQQDIAVFKPNSRIILSNKHPQKQPLQNNFVGQQKGKTFFMQPKLQLKQKLTKLQSENFNLTESQTRQFTLMNIQNDQIEQMLKIREEMLQKRECEELTKLNQQLIRKQLTQKQFLQQLKQLTDAFQLEKLSIDKAREDIAKGYSAAVRLIREAFCDARKIGYKLPLSKSSDSYKLNKHLGFGMLTGLNNVIIDELNAKEQVFAMKHVKEQRMYREKFDNQIQDEEDLDPVNKPIKLPPPSGNLSRLSALQAEYIDSTSKQFIRSNVPEQQHFSNNTSNNFSQSSSSIINNLTSSHHSFQNTFPSAQVSPKHQAIAQTPQSSIKSNIFTQNEHEFDDMSEESSEIEFSQEELKRFRKAQPYDPSIADMNRNLMIGKEFFEMQRFNDLENSEFCHGRDSTKVVNQSDPENLRMRLYRQVYEIEEHSIDSTGNEMYMSKPKDPKVELISQKQLQFLIFEVATELLMKPLFSEKFLQPKRQQMFGIRRVSDQCRKDFIRLVQNLMPNKEQIFTKINQNISPLPKELLKCMRIDFSEDEQEDNQQEYEEIGKYQMILDQQMCNLAIEKYHQRMVEDKQNKMEIQMLTGDNLDGMKQQFKGLWPENAQQKIFAYLEQRQKFVTNRKQHCQSIRWQFINMQLHCLFDAWNQQIIELKNNHNGFSGIGLNELTLSMIDRNRRVKQSQVQEIIQMSKFKLMKVLNYEEDIINQINYNVCRQVSMGQSQSSVISLKDKLHESYEKFSWVYVPNKDADEELDTEEESRWVYYADEALSYGLELVYLIEEEIFSELAKDLRKFTIKGQFL